MREIRELINEPVDDCGDIKIRTKQMSVGVPNYWSKDDVAHIWVNGAMYRITKKGSLIRITASDRVAESNKACTCDSWNCKICHPL